MADWTLAELFKKHPRPWSDDRLMIRDANGRTVLHSGGSRAEFGGVEPGDKLVLLMKMLTMAGNGAILEEPAPVTPIDETVKALRKQVNDGYGDLHTPIDVAYSLALHVQCLYLKLEESNARR